MNSTTNKTANRYVGDGAIEICVLSFDRVASAANAMMMARTFQPKNVTNADIVIRLETLDSTARSANAFGGLYTSSNAR